MTLLVAFFQNFSKLRFLKHFSTFRNNCYTVRSIIFFNQAIINNIWLTLQNFLRKMFESTELAQNCFSLNLHFLSKCSLPNKKKFFCGLRFDNLFSSINFDVQRFLGNSIRSQNLLILKASKYKCKLNLTRDSFKLQSISWVC